MCSNQSDCSLLALISWLQNPHSLVSGKSVCIPSPIAGKNTLSVELIGESVSGHEIYVQIMSKRELST